MAAVLVRFGISPEAPAFCALAAAGVPLAFVDAREARLPNLVTLPAYPACLVLLAAEAQGHVRVAEMNRQVAGHLDKIITALESDQPGHSREAAADASC